MCLDLGDCEFQDQRALLDGLSTLPRLRTLVLEGNPFTLACCYPGFRRGQAHEALLPGLHTDLPPGERPFQGSGQDER